MADAERAEDRPHQAASPIVGGGLIADVDGDGGDQTQTVAKPGPAARRVGAPVGLLLAVAGAFLLGDTASRLRLALEFVGHWWAWSLLGLAAVNVLRSVFRLESLVGPGLLASVAALGLAIQHGVAAALLLDFALPAVIFLAGLAILNSMRRAADRSWTRVLLTGRVDAPVGTRGILRPRAVFGEIQANLRPVGQPGSNAVEVHVTAIFGHVRLVVPTDWYLDPVGQGMLLTSVRDPMPNGTGDRIKLRVLGFCGAVTVVRK